MSIERTGSEGIDAAQQLCLALDELGLGANLHIGLVSTYPPRKCGIANFSDDLRQALVNLSPRVRVSVAALDRDNETYGPEVVAIIRHDVPDDYAKAAEAFAFNNVDVVLIQHEFGIYGNRAFEQHTGSYVLELSQALQQRNIPYIVTMHTTLSAPAPERRRVMRQLTDGSMKTIAFTETARRFALETGIVAPERLVVLPHGAPAVLSLGKDVLNHPAHSENIRPIVKQALASLRSRKLLTTFGLIGPGKGLELVVDAMPEIAREHPDVCYVIAGATHPEIVRQEGELYRDSIEKRIAKRGVADHVVFIDAFLTLEELALFLGSGHLYITPYITREQVCSGPLTFALATGCPVVATPFFHAEDVVTPERGRIVPFNDHQAMAAAVNELLGDETELAHMRQTVQEFGAKLSWPVVAQQIVALCAPLYQKETDTTILTSPPLDITHLERMYKKGGIVQFAKGATPETASGHCVDDVARLAQVAARLMNQQQYAAQAKVWLASSLDFLESAFDRGRFVAMRNMRTIDGKWLDDPHFGDHVGRTVYALGDIAAAVAPSEFTRRARALITSLLPGIVQLPYLRPSALSAIGLAKVPKASKTMLDTLRTCVSRLEIAFDTCADTTWQWFEDELTYDNGRLPQALIAAGQRLKDDELLGKGLTALDWYARECNIDPLQTGKPQPVRTIGNHWLTRARPKHGNGDGRGDEQPLDAAALVEALVEASQATGLARYASAARQAFSWFTGNNHLGAWMYDRTTGGCHDGLMPTGVNANMGAESTLSYYLALLSLAEAELITLLPTPIVAPKLAQTPKSQKT